MTDGDDVGWLQVQIGTELAAVSPLHPLPPQRDAQHLDTSPRLLLLPDAPPVGLRVAADPEQGLVAGVQRHPDRDRLLPDLHDHVRCLPHLLLTLPGRARVLPQAGPRRHRSLHHCFLSLW